MATERTLRRPAANAEEDTSIIPLAPPPATRTDVSPWRKPEPQIYDYKNDSYVVFGDTFPIRTQLKDLGGKFNRYLDRTGLRQGDTFKEAGWIFFPDKTPKEDVQALLETGNIPPPSKRVRRNTPSRRNANPVQMQTVTYSVPLPEIGMSVKLTEEDSESFWTVLSIDSNKRFVDEVSLKTGEGDDQEIVSAAVVAGKWEIIDYGADHTLFFFPKK